MSITIHQPEHREAPRGYSEAASGNGILAVAGQLAAHELLQAEAGFAEQLVSALRRFVEVVESSGATRTDILLIRIYVTSVTEYTGSLREFGRDYKEALGGQYPATTLVEVSGLIDPRAKVEIEGLASVPD